MTTNPENFPSGEHQGPHSGDAKSAPSVDILDLGDMQLAPTSELHSQAPILNNMNPLSLVKTKLRVVVGELEISIGELMAAKEHQVIPLKTRLDQPVDLVLEGHTIARGQLVAVDGHFAIRISDLPISLKT